MAWGVPVALVTSVLFALALVPVSERIPWLRAWRFWPVLRELEPVLAVVFGAQCVAHWFVVVSELRPPRFLMCLVVSLALAMPTAAAPSARARRIVAGVSIAVLSVLAFADAVYFRYFGGLLPLVSASTAKQGWAVLSSVAALSLARDLVFLALLASGVWLAASRGDSAPDGSRRLRALVYRAGITATLGAVAIVAFDMRSWLAARDSQKIFSWRQPLSETGLFGSHLRDVARVVRAASSAGKPPSAETIDSLEKFLDSTRVAVPPELFGIARGKNLIIVQVEAFQQWVIDTRAHGVEITPFLNRLKRERGFYFHGVWDQTLISPTADAEFLTLNSLHPMPDSAVVFRFSDNDFVALPGIFARQGYSTFSAHAFERGFWNRATIHPRYGFQQSFFDRELGTQPKIGWGIGDKAFLLRALERVDTTRAPFLAFLITLTSHHPYGYLPRTEYHIDTSGLPDMLAGYVGSVHYVDEALEGFFAALAKRPYAKDTVVAIYGDHEARIALDHAGEAQAREVLSLDARTLKDLARRSLATRKIPLLVVVPGAKEPRVFEQVGGQLDISPTLLHLFGLPKPKAMMGTPLVGKGGAVFRGDGSAVAGDRMRLADGNCRTLAGDSLPAAECDALARRGDEQLQASWAITRYNLAERLSGERRASRQSHGP
ncbi:MAG TPA: LTA synthase family protein [Polyangiaceae bacterium]|nr:LTA synthase family protein [Polyangiaceae bacterium]